MLASVNHPNVLRFYGVVTQSKADPTCVGIMTEYMRGGSLADMIRCAPLLAFCSSLKNNFGNSAQLTTC